MVYLFSVFGNNIKVRTKLWINWGDLIIQMHDDEKMAILACMEKILMESGADYNLIISRLQINHNATLVTCCEHPDYLRDVLEEIFGEKSKEIIKKISDYLREFDDENKSINEFLEKLEK